MNFSFKSLIHFASLLLFVGMGGCGSMLEEEHVLDYKFEIKTSGYQSLMVDLIDSFNRNAGFAALNLAKPDETPNSTITITDGLEKRDGKVGWGQWTTTRHNEVDDPLLQSKTTYRTIKYAMHLEFDKEYLDDNRNEKFDDGMRALEVVFNHEAGHGLKMDHHTSPNDVMFDDVSGSKNFKNFFSRVQAFFR